MFSVDHVLQEKLPNLSSGHPLVRKTLISLLRYLCHEREFQQFYQRYPHVEGMDFVEQALNYFDFGYRVFDREIERIPVQGRLVIVANHPIGSLDGLAVLKMVGDIRPDVRVVANDVLYALEPLRSVLLPVDNLTNRTRKDNIRAIREWLDKEGVVIIFPAGEVSRFGPSGIRDKHWNAGFLRFADTASAPILPLYVNGRNSVFFYALSMLAKPVSAIWLIREMFKKASQHVDIRIGHPIYPEQYRAMDVKLDVKAGLFRKHVYKLGKNKRLLGFDPDYQAIAHPENKSQLKQEIRQCTQRLGETADGKQIVLFRYQSQSVILREIGRLRELTFRAVKEGSGKRRDIDQYDYDYDHILLWDEQEWEIAGAYRMRRTQGMDTGQLYTATLFDFAEGFSEFAAEGLELGRSFVQPKYWGMRSLDYLWHGIGAYLKAYPDIRYLFGPVSISQAYSEASKEALVFFYSHYFAPTSVQVNAKTPFAINTAEVNKLREQFAGCEDYTAQLTLLKSLLQAQGDVLPTLYKQYTELCEPGGVAFHAFNVDADFADCIDGLMVMDLNFVKANKRKRYLGA